MTTSIASRDIAGATVIDITGPLTLGDPTSDLREFVTALLAQDVKKIVLNLAAVNYMDSAGIGTLLTSQRDARANGCSIRLASLHRRVEELLSLTRVIALFETFPDENSAIASF